ncbi:sugar transferase [Bacillus spongiae]|uniref:Sugar transferase n=1 Tax=Bacillus spongiae TaxID=2683610 RepID=A0ABU8HEE8_9BACI
MRKRLLDVFVALLGLLLFSPFFIPIAIVLKREMGSPIFFLQERPGKDGKAFILYKFRTMLSKKGDSGLELSDEERLTPVGRFLRKYSIDEVPQLINVLKGEMSLVGPRPLLMEYLPLYTKEQRLRHEVKPGITGWAQVNGRNAITWEQKFELDTWYVKKQSFLLDIKILAMTLQKVIKREGINQAGHATTEKFKGSKEVV